MTDNREAQVRLLPRGPSARSKSWFATALHAAIRGFDSSRADQVRCAAVVRTAKPPRSQRGDAGSIPASGTNLRESDDDRAGSAASADDLR